MTKFNLPAREVEVGSVPFDYGKAKKVFSNIGLATFLLVILPQLTVRAIVWALGERIQQFSGNYLFIWILALAPIYLIGIPIFILATKRIPSYKAEKQKLNTTTFTQLCFICFAVMNIGIAVTSLLMYLLSSLGGEQLSDPIQQIMGNSNIIFNLIATVILAPIFEELVFRKILIDKTAQYGEKISVFLSALLFGLFHTNIFQLIYTFALGYALALIYVRTRNIKHTILIHAITNLLYGNIMPILQANLYLISLVLTSAIGITGLILLVRRRKIFALKKAEVVIPRGKGFQVVFLNIGFILCFISIIYITYKNLTIL